MMKLTFNMWSKNGYFKQYQILWIHTRVCTCFLNPQLSTLGNSESKHENAFITLKTN